VKPTFRGIFVLLEAATEIVQMKVGLGDEHPPIRMRLDRADEQISTDGAGSEFPEIPNSVLECDAIIIRRVRLQDTDPGEGGLPLQQVSSLRDVKVGGAGTA
jgi:hypothetical protein